jgi:UDP-2,3-diacylglucosamine pyrophosphatase LpxH
MNRGVASIAPALIIAFVASGEPVPAQSSDRWIVAISDLHFGVGRDNDAWHSMEDFRWGPEFQMFLDEVHKRGGGKVDLVIAGDAFELWQSRTPDCAPPNRDAGCSEAEALARLKAVVAAHATELRALGRFAAAGDNRVVFVPGNHDAALLFPAVAKAAIEATGDGGSRVSVSASGYWLSPGKEVFVEHGHQMGKEVNKLRSWPRPFVGTNPARLERSWGEQFVQGFYNQYEAKYPIIDNVSEEGVGVRYAREVEGWVGTATAFGRFVQFYLTKLSLAQHVASLGKDSASGWDLGAVRKKGPAFFVESLPSDDPLGQAIRSGRPGFEADLSDFSDEDLRVICDARAQIYDFQLEKKVVQPTITKCPVKDASLGAVGQAILKTPRSTIVSSYLAERFAELKASAGLSRPFQTFIYGHTHLPDGGFKPMADSHPDWNPMVLNTGAWQRTITPEQLDKLKCRVPAGGSIIELTPEDLPACYSAVFVAPGAGSVPELRVWTTSDGKRWQFAATCQWSSPC